MCPANTVDCTTSSATTDDLIISEVGKGTSSNKWVEIYNPTDHDINLAPGGGKRYWWMGFNNGATALTTQPIKLGPGCTDAQVQAGNCKCTGTADDMVNGMPNPCWTQIIPARSLYVLCNQAEAATNLLSDKCHHAAGGRGLDYSGCAHLQ
jgi:hypothetical protein